MNGDEPINGARVRINPLTGSDVAAWIQLWHRA